MSQAFMKTVLPIASVVVAIQTGCSGKVRNYPPDDVAVGGGNATGGTLSTGGESSTGGASATSIVSSGGAAATGGASSGNISGGTSGGIQSTGGVAATNSATGGAMQTGGASSSNLTGGLSSSGGNSSSGGVTATTRTSSGGATATGGASSGNICGTASTAGPLVCGSTCCTADQFCIDDTSCGPKARPGSKCPYGNAQCTTDYCVGGYCCNSGSCGFGETCASGGCACSAGAAKVCNSCAVWDFEWGKDVTPWVNEICPNWASANGTAGIQISSSVFHAGTGSHSLVADINVELGTSVQAEIAVALPCAANLGGYGFSFWLYVAGPELPNWNDGLNIDTWSGSTFGETVPTVVGGVPTGQWFFVNEAIPISATNPVDRIGIRLVPSMSWTGQMYVDDFVLTAPKS